MDDPRHCGVQIYGDVSLDVVVQVLGTFGNSTVSLLPTLNRLYVGKQAQANSLQVAGTLQNSLNQTVSFLVSNTAVVAIAELSFPTLDSVTMTLTDAVSGKSFPCKSAKYSRGTVVQLVCWAPSLGTVVVSGYIL